MELLKNNISELWVFGYGSILWKTGFVYKSKKVGKIDGYVRRFWQGNVTHRGTPNSPGRVATIVPEKQGEVWGVAYELSGRTMIRKALHHLGMRECLLGGYTAQLVPFICRSSSVDGDESTMNVLVFSATPDNQHFLGPASEKEIAEQALRCSGESGHNIEYITKLAEFIRSHIPEDRDEHLFQIELYIRRLLHYRNKRPEHFYSPISKRRDLNSVNTNRRENQNKHHSSSSKRRNSDRGSDQSILFSGKDSKLPMRWTKFGYSNEDNMDVFTIVVQVGRSLISSSSSL